MELMLEPIEMVKDEEKSQWGKHVPIIVYGREVDIYISSEIVDPIEYKEIK